MKFLLLPSGSGGGFEAWLSKWFPPQLTRLDPEAHKEVLAYQYRVNRRGMEPHPTTLVGARIVRVVEGRSRRFARGTRESRQEIYA
jgi:hypothetical protein